MKTAQEIRNEIMQSKVNASFEEFMTLHIPKKLTRGRIINLVHEMMIEFATMAIEEQKKYNASVAKVKFAPSNLLHPKARYVVDPDSILNAPNVDLK